MHAFIFADASVSTQKQTTTPRAAALMEICGRSALEYTLDDIRTTGVKEVTIFVGAEIARIRQLLNDGEAWGLNVRLAHSRGDEAPSSLMRRANLSIHGQAMALRGDIFRPAFMSTFFDASTSDHCGFGRAGRILVVSSHQAEHFDLLDQSLAACALPESLKAISLGALPAWSLDDLSSVHSANQAMLNGSGKPPHVVDEGPMWLGTRALATETQVDFGRVCVGNHSQVHPSTRLRGSTSIGRGALIEAACTLHDCLVLPDTFVGGGQTFRDCVLGPQGYLNLRTGAFQHVDQPQKLSPVSQLTAGNRVPMSDRFVALCMLVLCLMLNRSQAVRDELRSIVKGEHRLLGIPRHLSNQLQTQSPWTHALQGSPGWLGISDCALPQRAPLSERLLTDRLNLSLRGSRRLLWLMRAAAVGLRRSAPILGKQDLAR